MAKERMYAFTWDFIGDVEVGRPNMGNVARIEVYRLFEYALRDVLEENYGTEQTNRLFYQAGFLAGEQFCEKFIGKPPSLELFVSSAQKVLEDLKVGILRVESVDNAKNKFILTVSEDLDCSGLPDIGYEVCAYDEGFIAGLFKKYTGKDFRVREIDCWCTGGRTCRFQVEAL